MFIVGQETRPIQDVLGCAKAYFVDWDGTLFVDGAPLEGAMEFLRSVGQRVWVISNNSTHLPADFEALLRQYGVELPAGRILLAGHQTILWTAMNCRGLHVGLIANQKMSAFAESLGVQIGWSEPDVVVALRDTAFSYEKLRLGMIALRNGARLIVANPDFVHPGASGTVVPETGALVAALTAGISSCLPQVIGKPSKHLFNLAMAQSGVGAEQSVVIGDNDLTDGIGAAAAGLRFVQIASGFRWPELSR